MKEINKAIVAIDFPETEVDEMVRLINAATVIRCSASDSDTIRANLKDAEIAILGKGLSGLVENLGPDMRWIHCDAAGLDFLFRPALADREEICVTCSSGRSSKALSEHVIMFMLALNYQVNNIWESRKRREYSMPFLSTAKALFGQSAGILGCGSIARELAPRLKALGMNTIGFAKSTTELNGMDKIYHEEEGLRELLTASDFIISTVALTDETYHLLNEERLSLLKPTSYVVNISRGSIIDEPALIKCLREGKIAGAGLDTFEQEPLGKESPLWTLPNVMMTPHVTPPQPDKHEVSLKVILDNIRNYRNEEPLRNVYKSYYRFSGKK